MKIKYLLSYGYYIYLLTFLKNKFPEDENVRVGLWIKLSAEELMLLNCGVGEYSWESPARWSSQSILKEISPEYSLEGLKLKLQFFGHLMQRTDSLEKTLMLGKIEGRKDDRGWNGWVAAPTWWTWLWTSSGSWWWTGKPGLLQSMGSQRVGHNWVTELNWTGFDPVPMD